MSPGRWAWPSTAFSTSPMMPTTLTLALRAASACIRPVTAAAPPMSPFMSSMPAAGFIELPPVSKVTPLPTKAIGLSLGLPPFQRMTTRRAPRGRPLSHAEQRAHAELAHLLFGQDLDTDAELFQRLRRGCELDRAEHVGGFIHKIPREHDAVGNRLRLGEGLPGGCRIGALDGEPGRLLLGGLAVRVVLPGLVFVEIIGPKQDARGKAGRVGSADRGVRQVEHDRNLGSLAELRGNRSTQLQPVVFLEVRRLADADGNQAIERRTLRRDHLDRRTGLSGEIGHRKGAIERVAQIVSLGELAQAAAFRRQQDDAALLRSGVFGKAYRRSRRHGRPVWNFGLRDCPVRLACRMLVPDIWRFSGVWQDADVAEPCDNPANPGATLR